jgi:hypothetical protein
LNVGRNEKFIEYETGCHTLQDSSEFYQGIGSNYKDYSQTSWHVFKTGRRIDYLELLLSEAFASPMLYFPKGTKIYANVYEGNVRTNNYKNLKKKKINQPKIYYKKKRNKKINQSKIIYKK